MQLTQRFRPGLVLLAAAAALQGCAVVRDDLLFKSEARAALGKDVSDSWSKSPKDLVDVARADHVAIHERRLNDINAYQANLQTLLQAQLAVGYNTPLMEQMASLQGHAGAPRFHDYCFKAPTKDDRYCTFWSPRELAGRKAEAQAYAAKVDLMQIRALEANIPARFVVSFQRAQLANSTAEVEWQNLSAVALRITGEKLPVCKVWTKNADGDKARTLWKERVAKSLLLTEALKKDATKVDDACQAKKKASENLEIALLWPLIMAKIGGGTAINDGKPVDPTLILSARDKVREDKPKNAFLDQVAKVEELQVGLDVKRLAAQLAKADVKKAQESVGDEKVSALEGTKKSIAELAEAVDKLKALADLPLSNEFAKDALLDLKRESLTEFFKAIKDAKPGEAPPTGGGKVATALILFANFSDKNNDRVAAAEKVGMESLALQDQLNKLEGQRVKREIALLEQRVKLEQAKLDAMVAQLDALINADAYVQGFKYDFVANAKTSQIAFDKLPLQSALLGKATIECPRCRGKTPKSVEIPPEMRSQLYLGVAGYVNAAVTYQPLLYRLEAQDTALSQSGRMDAADINIQIWNAVLSSNVQQLKTWAEFGITKDDFQKGLNNLFTGLIAVGVLK